MSERSFEEFLADLEANAAEMDAQERALFESPPLESTPEVTNQRYVEPPGGSQSSTKPPPRFCRYCGAPLRPQGRFCTQCGKPIAS